jgi:hypothetical protein
VIVTMGVRSADLLDDRDRVRALWGGELARTDEPRTIDFLTGGVSSIVVRVVTDEGAFVIKQALPQLRVQAAWYSRPERSAIEARCALALAELVPGSVPEVVAVVADRNALVMRSAPAGTETWKERLLRGEISRDIAAAVGRMLGRIHASSASRADLARGFATPRSSTSFASTRTSVTSPREPPISHRRSTRSPRSSSRRGRASSTGTSARRTSSCRPTAACCWSITRSPTGGIPRSTSPS